MIYTIVGIPDITGAPESVPAREEAIAEMEFFFENIELKSTLKITLAKGLIRDDLITDFEAFVSAIYRDSDGDRWFITMDGGRFNASKFIREARKIALDTEEPVE